MLLELPPLRSVGSLSKLHGFDGRIKANLKTDIRVIFPKAHKQPVFLLLGGTPVPFFYDSLESAPGQAIFHFVDAPDETSVKALLGASLLVPEAWVKGNLPGDQSADDLIGFTVWNQAGETVGVVQSVMPGKQTLMEVRLPMKSVFLPLHQDLLLSIDPKKRIIQLEIAEGLLDL